MNKTYIELVQELSQWIDLDVIAEEILVGLDTANVEQTVQNAQKVWLDVLENELHDAVRRAIVAKF